MQKADGDREIWLIDQNIINKQYELIRFINLIASEVIVLAQ